MLVKQILWSLVNWRANLVGNPSCSMRVSEREEKKEEGG